MLHLLLFSLLSFYQGTPTATNYPTIPKAGKTIESFVPKRWKIIAEAHGDLNKDGLPDAAVVIQSDDTVESIASIDTVLADSEYTGGKIPDTMFSEAPLRVLFILLRQPDNSWVCSVQSNHVILHSDQGGMQGDPFHRDDLEIKRGSLFITLEGGGGGSPYQTKHQFRYQNDDWYLIGFSGTSFDSKDWKSHSSDFNLLTGEAILEVVDENHPKNRHREKVNIGTKPLRKLQDFQPYEWKIYKDETI